MKVLLGREKTDRYERQPMNSSELPRTPANAGERKMGPIMMMTKRTKKICGAVKLLKSKMSHGKPYAQLSERTRQEKERQSQIERKCCAHKERKETGSIDAVEMRWRHE